MTFTKRLLFFFTPFLEVCKANSKILARISKAEKSEELLSDFWSRDASLEDLKALHSRTEDSRSKLEDKAKLSLLGISIAIPLATGLGIDVSAKYLSASASLPSKLFAVLLFISIIYLLSAGFASLKLLGNVNKSYYLRLEDLSLNETKRKHIISKAIELTNLQNLRRNNIMFAGMRCLIIGVSILSIAVVAAGMLSMLGTTIFPNPGSPKP